MDTRRAGQIRVPVGDDAARWATRGRSRPVLLVVHNVTSVRTLLERDEAYANGDPAISGTALTSDAWDLLKEVERTV
jgi:hypothetical protein